MIIDEPARGGVPDPTICNISGLEQLRAVMGGLLPVPPLTTLIGHKGTQVGPGIFTMMVPATPWPSPCGRRTGTGTAATTCRPAWSPPWPA